MNKLHLYTSMSRSIEEFTPRIPGRVEIFTCGPSTYRRPHIGNYRTFLYEDIVVRYLTYLGYDVHRVINFTDVEDKAIVEAENQGKDIGEITTEVHDHFYRETDLLGIRLPDEIPRSSTSIDQAVEIITELVRKGHAYWYEGNVFFDPLTIPNFGKLFRLDMSKWPKNKRRFRRDTYVGNRWNMGDFILWHGAVNAGSASWETRIGTGRPAWNIQDPAMILQQIGTQVDINCGGIDNIYRHHDYNIAVMEAFSGRDYANYYMHGAHLIVDGKPMSKSRGNILYPDNLVDQGYDHRQLRFFLIYKHYRKKSNFTKTGFAKTSAILDGFRKSLGAITRSLSTNAETNGEIESCIESIEPTFRECMNDDLRVGDAFDAISRLLGRIEQVTAGANGIAENSVRRLISKLEKVDEVFGVLAS